ncbi:hypothetical protein CCE28_00785 [Anaeromicrobium sediminis]|uniref:Tyr recombinase domain-containing protein n=2 Tax=Anaeromicrobium sediminis TaxID=1478221 RepID=A0A267MP87_9FIRM|nr:hypothetical protein CCE28_00785 [Anaeromicrobium sediminis]
MDFMKIPSNEHIVRNIAIKCIVYPLSKNDYVILNLKGERFNPSSFARRYTELRGRKEVKPIRFHDLRHTNATIMYKAGVKTKVMQERLGHSNISTTLDIYTHLFKEDQEAVSNILDNKVFG